MWSVWGTLLAALLLGGAEAAVIAADSPKSSGNGFASRVKIYRNPYYKLDIVDKLAESTMANVVSYMDKKVAAGTNNNCTLENAAVRREWSDLSEPQRQEYVAAVKCLMKLPPKSDKKRFPGALSRYDDFVAFHMTHAMQLHDNIHLFGAHMYYVHIFEQALRNECNYTGYQPYMNYDRYADDPINSPLFNGNASSLGGNGEPDPTYKGVPQPGHKPNIIKSGGGGGCVKTGPFSDMVVSLGPTSSSIGGSNIPKNPKSDGTGSNPRCLRRDVNRNAALGATAEIVYNLITNYTEIGTFYNELLGSPQRNIPNNWGLHTSGHYVAAVDPGGDPFTSPGDPAFYFHHTSLDRVWWIWRFIDVDKRLLALPFANGGMSMPMTKREAEATDPLESMVDMEWLGPPIKLKETHNQLGGNGGAFCYVYV